MIRISSCLVAAFFSVSVLAQNYDPLPLQVLSGIKVPEPEKKGKKPVQEAEQDVVEATQPAQLEAEVLKQKTPPLVDTAVQVAPAVLTVAKENSRTPVLVNASQSDSALKTQYAQKQLAMVPGVLEVVPIAKGHMNRIETPFELVHIKTTSTADIKTEKNIIYVNTTTSTPVVIYFYEHGEPDTALSLALNPGKIPPLNLKINVHGDSYGASSFKTKKAQRWEEKNDYESGLKELMQVIGKQEIPEGYSLGLANPAKDRDLFLCSMNGFDIELRQKLVGHHYIVGIHRITNRTTVPIEIREHGCYQKGVLAVSAWPQVVLRPNESSELYIVQGANTSAVKPKLPARPSVLN